MFVVHTTCQTCAWRGSLTAVISELKALSLVHTSSIQDTKLNPWARQDNYCDDDQMASACFAHEALGSHRKSAVANP